MSCGPTEVHLDLEEELLENAVESERLQFDVIWHHIYYDSLSSGLLSHGVVPCIGEPSFCRQYCCDRDVGLVAVISTAGRLIEVLHFLRYSIVCGVIRVF